jgi:hypothetical protein
MAKKAAAVAGPERGAKTRAIKEYLEANPKASPKVVVEALAAQGIQVSVGLVSVTKYSKKGKTGSTGSTGAKRGRKPAAGPATIEDLIDLKLFANKLGGIDATINLLNKLAQL